MALPSNAIAPGSPGRLLTPAGACNRLRDGKNLMSKSVERVRNALHAAGLLADIREMAGNTHTAAQAAEAAGCHLDQIMKSILFKGELGGGLGLFLTAGGNRVDPVKAGKVFGEDLVKADSDLIRSETGFSIGGVAPIGHLKPVRTFLDRRLLEFDVVWAAGGTPRHIFCIDPRDIQRITGSKVEDFLR